MMGVPLVYKRNQT